MGCVSSGPVEPKKSKTEEKREHRVNHFKSLEPRVVAECNLEGLKHNICTLQRYCEPILVTVSNDSFCHGAVQCAKLAVSLDVDFFGVSNVKEGIELREGGITPEFARIVVFNEPMQMELAAYCALSLGVVVSCRRSADSLREWEKLYSGRRKLLTWVLVDAGYTNMGVPVKNACKCIEMLLKNKEEEKSSIVFEGLILRQCDDRIDTSYPRIDLELVADLVKELIDKDISIPCIIFESNQTLLREWDQFARGLGRSFQRETKVIARTSMETYGYAKDDDNIPGLRRCLTLKAQIRDIRKVSRGEWVGLGEGWQAPSDSFIAIVACGYSDGYPAFINDEQANCHVRCKGSTYDIVGQVCSNHILIHLGGSSPNVSVGDWAVLFGPTGGADSRNLELSQLCDFAECSPCQTLCHLSYNVTKQWSSTGQTRKHTINRLSIQHGTKRDSLSEDRPIRKPKKKKKKKKKKDRH